MDESKCNFKLTVTIFGTFIVAWLSGLVGITTAKVCLALCLIVFVLVPLVFRYSVSVQRGILFLPFVKYSQNLKLSDPASIGLYATRNFYLTVRDEQASDGEAGGEIGQLRLGVWHILPLYIVKHFKHELNAMQHAEFNKDVLKPTVAAVEEEAELQRLQRDLWEERAPVTPKNEQAFYEKMLSLPGGTVVIYLHGNTATRGTGHRRDVYKLLRKLNYHVIAFDYRGYADSDPISPTEEGVVRDALAVYEYVSSRTDNPIIIWGHSLGTGVATHMCSVLSKTHKRAPKGVILESPFTNIRDEIRMHPFAQPFRNLPWFDITISEPMYANSLRFESDKHIAEFPQPVLVLHAKDDTVVPVLLGYKLFCIGQEKRPESWGPIELHLFEAEENYGHKRICYAPQLPGIVQQFVQSYRDASYS